MISKYNTQKSVKINQNSGMVEKRNLELGCGRIMKILNRNNQFEINYRRGYSEIFVMALSCASNLSKQLIANTNYTPRTK